MSVETCGNQEQIRLPLQESGNDLHLKGCTEVLGAGSCPKRGVQDVPGDALFVRVARSRVKSALVGRGVEKVGIGRKSGLCSVPVVDIEVDAGDALQAVLMTSVVRCHYRVVDEAESHSAVRLSVMPGRSDIAEGVRGLAIYQKYS